MSGDGQTYHLKELRRWLMDEVKDKNHDLLQFGTNTPPINTWPLVAISKTDCPQQQNGFDCGVFSTQFGRYISEGHELPILFNQNNMNYFRHLMALDICNAEKDEDFVKNLRC